MGSWPEPVERVARFLRESGTDARIEEYSARTPTAEEAARAAGASLEQIVKSLVFQCDGRYVLALTPGDRRADAKKVAAAAGAPRARIAGPAQVEQATGFSPGAVAPFPLKSVDAVLLDRRLLPYDEVWVGAGSPRHLAALAPADLARLTHGRTADLAQEPAA